MSDQPAENETGNPVTANGTGTTPEHKNPLSKAIAHLNLTQLTLVVVVVVFVWQWLDGKQQLNQIQHILAQRLAESDGSNKATQTLTLHSQEQVRELGGKLSLLENKYAESQSQRTALETLSQDLSSNRDQMLLAEVEQLLLVAGQQLQLTANIKAALIALQQADGRLQRLNHSTLSGLRVAINKDIERLRILPDVDVSAINTRLDKVVAMIDTLPLTQDLRASQELTPALPLPEDHSWKQLLREIWQEAKALLRIANTHQNALPLLSPTQTFFLRENLKLRLLAARLALLSRDEASFKHDIKTAQGWLLLYFDIKSVDGAQALNLLQKLNAANIKIELPDVSGSLEAVRRYRASREKETR